MNIGTNEQRLKIRLKFSIFLLLMVILFTYLVNKLIVLIVKKS